jgi:hypothetical protein
VGRIVGLYSKNLGERYVKKIWRREQVLPASPIYISISSYAKLLTGGLLDTTEADRAAYKARLDSCKTKEEERAALGDVYEWYEKTYAESIDPEVKFWSQPRRMDYACKRITKMVSFTPR